MIPVQKHFSKSVEISTYSLLWFPTDGRNWLIAVLCISLSLAPNVFCRISALYYFKINISSSFSLGGKSIVIEVHVTCI